MPRALHARANDEVHEQSTEREQTRTSAMTRTAALLMVLTLALASCKDKLPTQGDGTNGGNQNMGPSVNRIFYSMRPTWFESSRIYSIKPDGTDLKFIAEGILDAPPSGGKIAYGVPDADGYYAVYTADIDGSNPVEIRLENRDFWATAPPALSPDGKRIACMTANGSLIIASSDGSTVTRTENVGARYGDPTFTSDGAWVAFVHFIESDIFEVKPDSFGVERFLPAHMEKEQARPVALSRSPTDDRIAYAGIGPAHKDYDIYTTGNRRPRTDITNDSAADDLFPSWSPDGKMIAFIRDSTSLCTVSADGSGLTKIPIGGGPIFKYPEWSPDSKTLLCIRCDEGFESELVAVDRATGAWRVVASPVYRAFWVR
jgi:Tol biopolymer transport system component